MANQAPRNSLLLNFWCAPLTLERVARIAKGPRDLCRHIEALSAAEQQALFEHAFQNGQAVRDMLKGKPPTTDFQKFALAKEMQMRNLKAYLEDTPDVEAIADRLIERLRKLCPSGPFALMSEVKSLLIKAELLEYQACYGETGLDKLLWDVTSVFIRRGVVRALPRPEGGQQMFEYPRPPE